MPRRKLHRPPEEKSVLLSLVSRHVHDVESQTTRVNNVRKRKTDAWRSITKEFNALKKTATRQASQDDLRGMWYRMKCKAKHERHKAGPTTPLSWLADATEKVLQKVGRERTSPFQSPPLLAADDSDSDMEAYRPLEAGISVSGVEACPASQSSPSAAADYCPRKQFASSADGGEPLAFGEPKMIATSGSGTGSGLGQSRGRPRLVVVDQTLPPTTTIDSASSPTPAMRSPLNTSASGTGTFFQHGVNSVLPNAYQVSAQTNTSSIWASGNVMMSPQEQFGSAQSGQSPMRPTPESNVTGTAEQDASRLHVLQNMQAQLHIRQIQSLAAMEKNIYEHKMRSQEVTVNLTQKLHEAQMKANAVTLEGKLAMEKIILKRNEDLYLAKLRSEEEILNMQRELHDMKMETARLELEQAKIANQVVNVKLQQAELELEQFQTKGT